MLKTLRSLAVLCALVMNGCSTTTGCVPFEPSSGAGQVGWLDTSITNPLDPLTSREIRAARTVLKSAWGGVCGPCRIPYIGLREPEKGAEDDTRQLAAHRLADAVVARLDNGTTFRAVVDVTGDSVLAWNEIVTGQAPWSEEEYPAVWAVLGSNDSWRKALGRRGIVNIDDVFAAALIDTDDRGDHHRRVRVIAFLRSDSSSVYANPIEGLMAVVDLTVRRVERIVDEGDSLRPRPKFRGAEQLAASSSLYTCQPRGPSYSIQGHEVRWLDWRFRFGLNAREGLVLYSVGRERHGVIVPILARASLSEMFVPYGSPDSTWEFRAAFDVGAYMLGRTIDSLTAGSDAPSNAQFFDAVLPSDGGAPFVVPRAATMYERDGGVLRRSGETVERSRELVLRSVYTVGNYDYGINWIFGEDGSLRVDIELSGVLFVQARPTDAEGAAGNPFAFKYGHVIGHNIVGIHHQHFFNFRLDFDVAGLRNDVIEMNTAPAKPGGPNGLGGAFVVDQTLLTDSRAAIRDANPVTGRTWLIVNRHARNAAGGPVAVELVPGDIARPFTDSASALGRKAAFAFHQLWVTPYAPSQRFAAGDFPVHGDSADDLGAWARQKQPIADRDIVVWYTVGVTHLPRPEDWPVMPTVHAGFVIRPYGFDP